MPPHMERPIVLLVYQKVSLWEILQLCVVLLCESNSSALLAIAKFLQACTIFNTPCSQETTEIIV